MSTPVRSMGARRARPPFNQRVRGLLKDVAIRLGVWPYRHLDWSDARWDAAYRERATDAFGDVAELARYSLLAGYLRQIGGRPAVLDVGCGAGLLRARVDPATFGSWTGIDHTEAAISQARDRGFERARFAVARAQDLTRERFDVAICNEVLYFVPEPERSELLACLAELIAPRGHLLVSAFRHPGDVVLWRHIGERFELVDRVWARNERNLIGWRGWGVAWYRLPRRASEDAPGESCDTA